MTYTVYRFVGRSGETLYVGCTGQFAKRLAHHIYTRPWFEEVVKIDLARYPNPIAARKAEAALIEHLKPKYNVDSPDPDRVGLPPPEPRQDGLTCPKCLNQKERREDAYCLPCMRQYQTERRRAAGMKPKAPPTVTCPRCEGVKEPGPTYCKPCKKQVNAEYRKNKMAAVQY